MHSPCKYAAERSNGSDLCGIMQTYTPMIDFTGKLHNLLELKLKEVANFRGIYFPLPILFNLQKI